VRAAVSATLLARPTHNLGTFGLTDLSRLLGNAG
jgi:hypothetical protein